jgi:hypothetical protein
MINQRGRHRRRKGWRENGGEKERRKEGKRAKRKEKRRANPVRSDAKHEETGQQHYSIHAPLLNVKMKGKKEKKNIKSIDRPC